MNEYISREAVLKKLQMQLLDLEADQDKGEYSELCENRGARDALDEAIYDIKTLKSADVKPALSEEEYDSLCERMVECVNMGVENGHIAADSILLEVLKKMGYEKLVELYRELDKWYA